MIKGTEHFFIDKVSSPIRSNREKYLEICDFAKQRMWHKWFVISFAIDNFIKKDIDSNLIKQVKYDPEVKKYSNQLVGVFINRTLAKKFNEKSKKLMINKSRCLYLAFSLFLDDYKKILGEEEKETIEKVDKKNMDIEDIV